jgi:hypothetical protein
MGVIVSPNRIRHFVRFLEDAWPQGGVSLLAIPGTTARPAQLRDNLAKPLERIAQIRQSERCVPNSEISPELFLPT